VLKGFILLFTILENAETFMLNRMDLQGLIWKNPYPRMPIAGGRIFL
jgi:hypothetical protein